MLRRTFTAGRKRFTPKPWCWFQRSRMNERRRLEDKLKQLRESLDQRRAQVVSVW